jgi:hypothetical protein
MHVPFIKALDSSKNILIAGAGGGFDVVSGIPLYIYLRSQNKNVVLANLSFTALDFIDSEQVINGAYLITQASKEVPYFPEKYILEWLVDRGENPIVYGLSNELGVLPLTKAYNYIAELHQIDTVILVDGGTDSLMFGDESKVGTIVEDSCSIIAAAESIIPHRYLAALGFGVEHEFNHCACLENIAHLTKEGYFLGSQSLVKEMPETKAYMSLVELLNQKMGFHKSIVTNSVASAINGEFGDFHATYRTKNSEQFVSPLMSQYWYFDLNGIASNIKYADKVKESQTMNDVAQAFTSYRLANPRRNFLEMPLK